MRINLIPQRKDKSWKDTGNWELVVLVVPPCNNFEGGEGRIEKARNTHYGFNTISKKRVLILVFGIILSID